MRSGRSWPSFLRTARRRVAIGRVFRALGRRGSTSASPNSSASEPASPNASGAGVSRSSGAGSPIPPTGRPASGPVRATGSQTARRDSWTRLLVSRAMERCRCVNTKRRSANFREGRRGGEARCSSRASGGAVAYSEIRQALASGVRDTRRRRQISQQEVAT